jgi:hypothetical protein
LRSYGEDEVRIFAVVRELAMAKLARQQWRALSSVAACGGGDEMKFLGYEQVG